MRIVVISDSHGNSAALGQVLQHRPDAGLFLHLGDGIKEFEDFAAAHPDIKTAFVCGNSDYGCAARDEELLLCQGKKLLITHGHRYTVKTSTALLLERARLLEVNVCCYGHTHIPLATFTGGIYLLNPGSLSTRSSRPSYGVIDLTGAGIATHIVYL